MTNNSLPPFDKPNSDYGSNEFAGESALPIEIPITDVLDLHTVSPRDAQAVVKEYLRECYRLNLTAIRIVHGRGIGVQRAMVRKVLERTEFVAAFGDAPMEAGGWGATVITLRRRRSGDSEPA